MAFAYYHPRSTEPVGNGPHPVVPPAQSQVTPVAVHHHRIPQTWQNQKTPNEYQHEDWRQHNQYQHMYQDPQHERQQHPLYRNNKDSQTQHSADVPQYQSSALANLPPASTEILPLRGQPSERRYDLWSSEQDRHDLETSIPHQCDSDHPQGAPAAPAPAALFHSQRSTSPPDGGALLSPLSSPQSLYDECNNRSDSIPAGSGSREPSFGTHYHRISQDPDAIGQTSGQRQRVKTACRQCRRSKRRCDKEIPCRSCQKRNLACDRSEAAPAITKGASENHAPKLQEIRNMMQETMQRFIDRKSIGAQDEKRQKNSHDPEDPVMWPKSTKSRMLSPPRREDEHRTGPHHLIHSWSSLRVLLQAADIGLDCAYVMEAEDRPSLCLYPEDEKVDNWDDAQVGDKAPPDAPTVETLHASYIKNIHVMHPFLDTDEIRDLLDDFVAWHMVPCQQSVAADHYHAASGHSSKRRRHNNHSGVPQLQRPRQGHLLGHAVIYLILALGKICMHSNPLPADSPSIERSGKLSGSLGHMYEAEPPSPSLNNAAMVPRVSSQIPSVDGVPHGNKGANTREVPGLDYYVKAVEIFGVYNDSNDLICAHLFLLAGLYKGQLARVRESMSWYAMAGRVLRQLLQSHGLEDKNHWTWTSGGGKALKERSQKFITDKHRSSIVRASYSCAQLESDILADLDLPSSGIAGLETMLPMPDAFPDVSGGREKLSQPANIFFHFTSQVYLRSRLNQIHRQLYGSGCEELSLPEIQCLLRGHEITLGAWQKGLPADISWDLEDLPPTNILQARMRAKYWGARYLINRPFLDYILHIKSHPRLTVDEVASDSRRKPRREAEFHLFRAISEMDEEEVQMGYMTCIEAAEKSTIAFDNVLGRPIVTNIHGTAHAQFGNVLVLCDVYWHPDLCQLVDETTLRHLLSRTISFLDKLAPISPTCRIDCLVLEKVQRLIFDIPN